MFSSPAATTAPAPAADIDGVVHALDGIVEDCRTRGCRLGLFAALYRRVTVEVKGRMDKGQFRDADRMERLDTQFANRYLVAYGQHRAGDPPSRAWTAAFAARDDDGLVVLQHLLLGMNAHILLDLGVTTAEIARAHGTADLKHDFDAINRVLADLVDEIQDEIGRTSPLLRTLDRLGGRLDERLLGYGLARARRRAWRHSLALRAAPERISPHLIGRIDGRVERIASGIRMPPRRVRIALETLREAEREPVRTLIDRLA